MRQMTFYRILYGKKVLNVHDGRPDGSVLLRLSDGVQIVLKDATVLHGDGDDVVEIKPCL